MVRQPRPPAVRPPPAVARGDGAPPWPPILVAVIAAIIPAGGAILTISNLRRLQALNRQQAREQAAVLGAVFVVGYAVLVSFGFRAGKGGIDSGASVLLSLAAAGGSLLIQRRPYQHWRVAEKGRPAGFPSAVATALLYELGVLLLAVLVGSILLAAGA